MLGEELSARDVQLLLRAAKGDASAAINLYFEGQLPQLRTKASAPGDGSGGGSSKAGVGSKRGSQALGTMPSGGGGSGGAGAGKAAKKAKTAASDPKQRSLLSFLKPGPTQATLSGGSTQRPGGQEGAEEQGGSQKHASASQVLPSSSHHQPLPSAKGQRQAGLPVTPISKGRGPGPARGAAGDEAATERGAGAMEVYVIDESPQQVQQAYPQAATAAVKGEAGALDPALKLEPGTFEQAVKLEPAEVVNQEDVEMPDAKACPAIKAEVKEEVKAEAGSQGQCEVKEEAGHHQGGLGSQGLSQGASEKPAAAASQDHQLQRPSEGGRGAARGGAGAWVAGAGSKATSGAASGLVSSFFAPRQKKAAAAQAAGKAGGGQGLAKADSEPGPASSQSGAAPTETEQQHQAQPQQQSQVHTPPKPQRPQVTPGPKFARDAVLLPLKVCLKVCLFVRGGGSGAPGFSRVFCLYILLPDLHLLLLRSTSLWSMLPGARASQVSKGESPRGKGLLLCMRDLVLCCSGLREDPSPDILNL